jgi:ribonuclease HI
MWNGAEIKLMWISSHVGLENNEFVDEQARHAAVNGAWQDLFY